ncbi:acetyltransferase [Chryseobacterium sp. SN22]|uniref:acetyltransferase n=1 Tax=Chryseobacterium sp. SN22 TaxID=2606431 RepID=UPI0011EE7A75|nr:acetyltransferase [Chryseobacterium sp. SN22]KAA0126172.1 acetyltransferase [Chryseobacterium sp. SN22]
MKPIIFIGIGAVASEIISYLEDIQNQDQSAGFEIYGFLDDDADSFNVKSEKYGFKEPFLGSVADHRFSDQYSYIFGFSNPSSKENVIRKLDIEKLNFPTIIHPSVILSKSAKLGKGNIIYPNSVIGPNCKIGNFNLITSYSFISHDCEIGDYNFFSTAGLAGNVNVGNKNFFGIRSTVIPSVTIGSENTIQAGMVIDKNVSDHETVFYRFKEKVTIIRS